MKGPCTNSHENCLGIVERKRVGVAKDWAEKGVHHLISPALSYCFYSDTHWLQSVFFSSPPVSSKRPIPSYTPLRSTSSLPPSSAAAFISINPFGTPERRFSIINREEFLIDRGCILSSRVFLYKVARYCSPAYSLIHILCAIFPLGRSVFLLLLPPFLSLLLYPFLSDAVPSLEANFSRIRWDIIKRVAVLYIHVYIFTLRSASSPFFLFKFFFCARKLAK